MPSNHLILSCPLLILPSIFSNIRLFESALGIKWPKYWSLSFNICPSNEYSVLINFRIDCFDLLASQGTLRSLPKQHSSKASIVWHSAFFMVQLSHSYMMTGKTIALTRQTFVSKVISLLFNILSRFVTAFLPNKCLSFHGCSHYPQWFWSPRKSVNCFYFSRYIQKETKSANILISVVSCSYTGIHCH